MITFIENIYSFFVCFLFLTHFFFSEKFVVACFCKDKTQASRSHYHCPYCNFKTFSRPCYFMKHLKVMHGRCSAATSTHILISISINITKQYFLNFLFFSLYLKSTLILWTIQFYNPNVYHISFHLFPAGIASSKKRGITWQ